MNRNLSKSTKDNVLTGTLGGIGEYLGIEPNIVRLGYILLSIYFIGSPLIVYLILVFLIPAGYRRDFIQDNYCSKERVNRKSKKEQYKKNQTKHVSEEDWSDF